MIHDKIKDQDYIKQNEATILMPVYRWLVKPPMIEQARQRLRPLKDKSS